ncbi:MAG: AmmeMemoRadiSam system protein A [Ignavibacteria bacterium]
MELSDNEKEILLAIARDAINCSFSRRDFIPVDLETYPSLKLKAGAFVTLTKKGELRGCIGYIISDDLLIDTIRRVAVKASFEDPRFPELREPELDTIDIEISILSPPFKMNSYDDIILGIHGVILDDSGHRGLLLPQVPIEHNMNKEQFLTALCRKAGLPSMRWKEQELKISLFTATVFSEKEIRSRRDAGN